MVADVPEHPRAGDPAGDAAEDVRLHRVRVDDLDPVAAQDVRARAHCLGELAPELHVRERPGVERVLAAVDELRVHRQDDDVGPELVQPLDERAVLAGDHRELHPVGVEHAGEAQHRELAAAQAARMVEQGDADRFGGDRGAPLPRRTRCSAAVENGGARLPVHGVEALGHPSPGERLVCALASEPSELLAAAGVAEERRQGVRERVGVAFGNDLAGAAEHLRQRSGVGGDDGRAGGEPLRDDASELLLPALRAERGHEQDVVRADAVERLVLGDGAGEHDVVAGECAQARLVRPGADDLEGCVESLRGARERLHRETAALLRDESRDEADAPAAVRIRPRRRGGDAERQHVERPAVALAPQHPAGLGRARVRGGDAAEARCAPSAGRRAGSACRRSAPCRSRSSRSGPHAPPRAYCRHVLWADQYTDNSHFRGSAEWGICFDVLQCGLR